MFVKAVMRCSGREREVDDQDVDDEMQFGCCADGQRM